MGKRIRIGLVDYQPIFRRGVVLALKASANLTVVTEGGTAADALRIASRSAVDILLLGVEIPDHAIATSWAIRQLKPETKVLIVVADGDNRLVVDALRSGAHGCISRDFEGADLIRAIELIHRRRFPIAPARTSRLLSSNSQAFLLH